MSTSLSGFAVSMGGIRNMYKISIQKTNVKVALGRQITQMEKKKKLKWIVRKLDGRVYVVCCCNKISDSIRGREFIEQLSNYQHLKEGLSYRIDAQFQKS
jgi:calcineurin-like phosphoesterase family protein